MPREFAIVDNVEKHDFRVKMIPDRPLVSVLMITYNQENYVKEALLSVLNQSYDNVEVVVSDDCSKDGTWGVIESEVDRYLRKGGRHRNILLNRNLENLGVSRNFETAFSKSHGNLIVSQAGDDISMPERVECIVQAWERNPNATVFCHGAYNINLEGNRINNVIVKTDALFPLGALMAYSSRVFKEFGQITEKGTWEDDVYGHRALMLGDLVQIDAPLLLYRIGGEGLSSGCDGIGKKRNRMAVGCLASARQSRMDLESCRMKIGEQRYGEILRMLDWYELRYKSELILYNTENFAERFGAFHRLCAEYGVFCGCKVLIYLRLFAILFLPRFIVRWIRYIRVFLRTKKDDKYGKHI